MVKLGLVLIAALCLLLNQGIAEFSSLLKTVVPNAISPPFRINGPNGTCAHISGWIYLQLYTCGAQDILQRFTIYDDGTLRVKSMCLTARGFTQGSLVEPDDCNNENRDAITWNVKLTDRQILHPASGLVLSAVSLSAVSGAFRVTFTLEANLFSSYQTFRLDYLTPVPTAHILGMNGLCLLSSNNEVWLGTCGISSAAQKWHIYPDGTIRPQERTTGCLSFDNGTNRTVLVATCGLAATTERWVLKENGAILNERFNLALDVAGANPSLRKILVYPPSGGINQQWRIFYDS